MPLPILSPKKSTSSGPLKGLTTNGVGPLRGQQEDMVAILEAKANGM